MILSERRNMPDRYAIHAKLLFPGGGRPALADQLVEIENGCIVAIDDAGSGHAEASFGIVTPDLSTFRLMVPAG